ncbi:MAG: hypothetical protein ACK5LY_08770 [Lachnospirales bacterium]
MDIQKLTTGTSYQTKTYATSKDEVKSTDTEAAENASQVVDDTTEDAVVVEKNTETTEKDTDYTIDKKKLSALYNEHEQKAKQYMELVNTLFKKQAEKNGTANYSYTSTEDSAIALKNALQNGTLEVDQATIDQAKEDVSEDGYYGVNKTSDRLLDFAKAISGGDPEKIELLRDAVIEGFKQAEQMWGDELPQISKDTFNATMDKFDAWASETGTTLSSVERM